MDKRIEVSEFTSRFFKNILIVAISCLLGNCTQEYTQRVDITEDGYIAELNGVLIDISPINVSVGEEVIIELTHKQGKKVEVEIKSTSLSYQKTVKTPSSINIKMEAEGVHDISFVQKGLGCSMTSETAIIVK